ncbi:nitrilase 2 [Cavenderia fasciculata]|uniref:Nitrilase 2 n=1 Tax=Cavenderia fasciculata TaxID=261658 RepID=F4QBM3_CACFS|nr:nitrilase 2 [Cavenderia fasciculata]EGG14611.1 nitrilase 2 [Cavenderia fasciculata]|eukprot:XP_004351119.1 nitrilase 2 [Cavenderia fasciculata]
MSELEAIKDFKGSMTIDTEGNILTSEGVLKSESKDFASTILSMLQDVNYITTTNKQDFKRLSNHKFETNYYYTYFFLIKYNILMQSFKRLSSSSALLTTIKSGSNSNSNRLQATATTYINNKNYYNYNKSSSSFSSASTITTYPLINSFIRQYSSSSSSSSFTKMDKLKFAGLQLLVGDSKKENIENAYKAIKEASSNGAQLICLPECFNCPYSTAVFKEYSEIVDANNLGDTTTMLSHAAKEFGVWIIGGSIPERSAQGDLDNIYNTCTVFNPSGELVATHRKVHLFDINVPGRIKFCESDSLTRGDTPTVIDVNGVKIGIGICYDVRFPELALLYGQRGCSMLVYPGAFNMTTGPAHWELLMRSRAVDNQMFVSMVSPARNPKSSYSAWGHSSVVNPWGEVISTTEHDPSIIYADIDFAKVKEMRDSIPVYKQKRTDIYNVQDLLLLK